MKGYESDFYKSELELTETDSILLFVSERDAVKIQELKRTDYRFVMNCYCEKLRHNLNLLLGAIAHLEYVKKNNK